MAAASILVDKYHYTCPICLDLLKDPVTINCGHNFCLVCINESWDQEVQKGIYSCPQCRETFSPRPVLRKNNVMAEVVEKLEKTELQHSSHTGPGDVDCDFCTETKHKAIKSCLTCLVSFCETHLQPHLEIPALKKHELVKASELQEKICSTHGKPIEVYCRTDQSSICYLCVMDEHKGHDTFSVAAEEAQKQRQLKKMQMKCQQSLQEKREKMKDVKQAVDTVKRSAQEAVEDADKIFAEMMRSIEKRRSEVTQLIRDQEEAELSQAERLLRQLEQEIADLERRDSELKQLLHIEDHIQFLQKFQTLSSSSGFEDYSSNADSQDHSFDGVRKAFSDLKERLEKFHTEEFPKVLKYDFRASCKDVKEDLAQQSHSMSLISENKEVSVVHRGIRCDGCKMKPIQGPRFKCLDCDNFDFCENCFDSSQHYRHSWGRIDKPASRPGRNNVVSDVLRQWFWEGDDIEEDQTMGIHSKIRCDGCQMCPIKGPRFMCLYCVNFDYCQSCFSTRNHKHGHLFQKFQTFRPQVVCPPRLARHIYDDFFEDDLVY